MRLKDFKTAASIVTGTSIRQVYFDYSQVMNTERVKLYPYVFWDLNSWKGRISWANVNQIKEKVTVRAFCFDSFNKSFGLDILDAWDGIRAYFRVYETLLNNGSRIAITNLNDQAFEYFSIGLNVDSEIAVAFDLEMNLFCDSNTSSMQLTADSTHTTIDSQVPINL